MKLIHFLYAIFPILGNIETSKKLRKRIKNEGEQADEKLQTPLNTSSNPDAISDESLKEQYEDALRVKDKFEDKAKATIVCVTVSITLIMGASGLLTTLANRFEHPLILWIGYALFIYAVLSMIFAAIMDIKVIVDENVVYSFPVDCPKENTRETYDICVGQNVTQNYIRNSYVFSAYECIRNALICLFIIMVFAVIPINTGTVRPYVPDTNSQRSFSYSESTLDKLGQYDMEEIRKIIETALPLMQTVDGQTYSIADNTNKLFIKFQLNGNDLNVLSIEEISWEQ